MDQRKVVSDMYNTCFEMIEENKSDEEILQCITDCKKSLTDPRLVQQLILFQSTLEEIMHH
jgi:response regulator RpfG family c-di-GMP phosphodiesterase